MYNQTSWGGGWKEIRNRRDFSESIKKLFSKEIFLEYMKSFETYPYEY